MTQSKCCDDCYYAALSPQQEPCKACKATDDGFTHWREVPMTNAEFIRAMSDEGLAEWLTEFAAEAFAACALKYGAPLMDKQERLAWLQQPEEEGGPI